jgi:hypothetical protein
MMLALLMDVVKSLVVPTVVLVAMIMTHVHMINVNQALDVLMNRLNEMIMMHVQLIPANLLMDVHTQRYGAMIMMLVLMTGVIAKKVVKQKRLFVMTTTPVLKILVIQPTDVNTLKYGVMIMMLVPLTGVIAMKVVKPRKLSAMTMTHVLMMNVTHTLDALIHLLIATITINVPMILATQAPDANINVTNVNTKMLAIL